MPRMIVRVPVGVPLAMIPPSACMIIGVKTVIIRL